MCGILETEILGIRPSMHPVKIYIFSTTVVATIIFVPTGFPKLKAYEDFFPHSFRLFSDTASFFYHDVHQLSAIAEG